MSAGKTTADAAEHDPVTALRLILRANGYLPVPVQGKTPYLPGWQIAAQSADEAEYRRWRTTFAYEAGGKARTYRGDLHTNTGLACGALVGVDLDVPVPELAMQMETLATAILGHTPLRRIGQAPKLMLAFRTATPLAKIETPELYLQDGTKLQIELLGAGQQFVAYGVHPDTKRAYLWPKTGPDLVPLADLPEVNEADLRTFVAAAEAMLRQAGGLTTKERDGAIQKAAGGPARPQPSYSTASRLKGASGPRSGVGGSVFFKAVNRAALDALDAWVPRLFPTAKRQTAGTYRVTSADLGRAYEEDLSIHSTGIKDFGSRTGMSPCDVMMEWGGTRTVQEAAFILCEWLGRKPAEFGWKEPKAKQKAAASTAELDGFPLNEDGVAQAFTKAHHGSLRYCHHAQHWFVWTGSVWKREETRLAFSWAREVCRNAAHDLSFDDKVRHVLARASTAAAVERFAQSDRAFAVTSETWDCNIWVLGTPAGTVDLRTGELRLADRRDHITKLMSVAPAPLGTAHPLWSKFLDEATGNDKELQGFLQRFAGYCLTGDVAEEMLAFFYGDGGTGKGTFLGTIVAIMADYAVTVPIEVFTAGSRLNLEYYRAQMAGARLVTASETEAGATWAESQIKEMTGNETPLSARHPYGKPFTYRPQFKIGLVGNHAPRLKGRSKGMERRLRITPFKHKPSKPDPALKDKLRAEFPAILRWVIDGCLAWQRHGLGTCPAIEAETSTYFEQQNGFGRWLDERCTIDGTVSERPSKLLADFLTWAKDSGEAAATSTEFRELIERTAGLRYATNDGRQWVRGVGLKAPDDYQDHRAEPDE